MNNSSIKIHPLPSPIPASTGQLSLDIIEKENQIIVIAPIAGVEKEDIQISVTKDVLVINGERKAIFEADTDNYYTQECFWGPFSRSIILPLEADTTKINATFENCILVILVPLIKRKESQVIKIKSPQ